MNMRAKMGLAVVSSLIAPISYANPNFNIPMGYVHALELAILSCAVPLMYLLIVIVRRLVGARINAKEGILLQWSSCIFFLSAAPFGFWGGFWGALILRDYFFGLSISVLLSIAIGVACIIIGKKIKLEHRI